jgi:lactoylglutathione lyase
MLGLRTAIYHVSELAQAKEWYTNAFGTPPYFDEPFYVGFNIAGYELGLLPAEKGTGENSTGVVAYWGVSDVQMEFARFLSLGATAFEKPTNVGGDIVIASVKDPWGNVVGIIYNPEFQLP